MRFFFSFIVNKKYTVLIVQYSGLEKGNEHVDYI